MKVLYVTANAHLRSTTSSLNAIIRQLMPRGVDPVLLFKAGTHEGSWHDTLAREGISCHVMPLAVPDKRSPFSAATSVARLARFIRRHRIELVHCNEHELYPALRHAARLASVPILTSLHWNLESDFGYWAFARPYVPAALQFLSRAQLEASRTAIPADVPTERVRLLMSGLFLDEFLARGGDGGDLRRAWNISPRTVVLGAASAIKRRKHLEDFIKIVSRLRRAGRDVVGVLAGGGAFEDAEYRRELERLIAAEGLEQHCRMVGNLDPVTPFFKAVDVVVNPAEMEILSMSMCEAMACQKPVIAYAVGGNPETVHDPWCVVPFGDLDSLTDRAARLVDDPTFRRDMGTAAEQYVRAHFDAPVLAERQARIYREIMGRPVLSDAAPRAQEAGA